MPAFTVAQCCSGGVPIGGSLGLGSNGESVYQTQLSFDVNRLNQLYSESERLNDVSRLRNTYSLLWENSFRLSERFSLSILLTAVQQERKILQFDESYERTLNQGPGDGIAMLRYQLLPLKPQGSWNMLIGSGAKAPLGRTDYTDARGIQLPADLQPGSGAWDWVNWLNTSFAFPGRPNRQWFLISTLRLTGTNPDYLGVQAYQFGNEFQLQTGISDRFSLGKWLIDPQLSFRFRHNGVDLIDGNILANSGGNWVFLVPGGVFHFSPELALRFSLDVPIYHRLVGTQLSSAFRGNIGLFFKLKKKSTLTPSTINTL